MPLYNVTFLSDTGYLIYRPAELPNHIREFVNKTVYENWQNIFNVSCENSIKSYTLKPGVEKSTTYTVGEDEVDISFDVNSFLKLKK